MASDINTVTLVGRLTRDPELRQTSSGKAVATLRLASNSSARVNGEWEDVAGYFNVTLFERLAESAARNLGKGSRVGVVGRLSHRQWETQDGQKRESVEINAHTLQFLSAKPEGSAAPAAAQSAAPVDDDDIPF